MATRSARNTAPAADQPQLPVAPPITGPDNDATAVRCTVAHPQLGPCTRLEHPPDERHDNGKGVQWGGPAVTVQEPATGPASVAVGPATIKADAPAAQPQAAQPPQQPAPAPAPTPQPPAQPQPQRQVVQPQVRPAPQQAQGPRMVLPTARPRQPDAPKPWTMLLYGPPGTGKTTFGVDADSPIFLPFERSSNVPDEMQFPMPATWAEAFEAINVLGTSDHPYRTLVIDTADAAEPMLAEIVKRKAAQGAGAGKGAVHYVSDVAGGYGRGAEAMVEEWQVLLQRLERLRSAKAMNVLVLAHAKIAPFRNPDGADFDMWQPKMDAKVAGTLIGWAEIVGFCNIEITTTQASKRARAKGGTTGAHWLYVGRNSATFWAKNRHGLPDRLPLDFGAFAQALEAGARANTDELVAAIRAKAVLLTGQTFTDRAQRVVAFTDYVDAALAKQPPRHELLKLDSRLAARLQELEQPSDGTDDEADGAKGGGQ